MDTAQGIGNDADRNQNDLNRLDTDTSELVMSDKPPTSPPVRSPTSGDTEYNTELWRDVDDEKPGEQTGLR